MPGTPFQFFPGGGQNFDRLPRGGAKYKKNKILYAKTQKITFFQNQKVGNAPPPCPPK